MIKMMNTTLMSILKHTLKRLPTIVEDDFTIWWEIYLPCLGNWKSRSFLSHIFVLSCLLIILKIYKLCPSNKPANQFQLVDFFNLSCWLSEREILFRFSDVILIPLLLPHLVHLVFSSVFSKPIFTFFLLLFFH